MQAQGFNIAESGHPIMLIPPKDINGADTYGDVFSMRNAAHATIIVAFGATSGVPVITLEEGDDFSPTNFTAIPFNVYKEETTDGDTLGALVAATVSGFSPSGNDRTFHVIELDAAALSDGYPTVRLKLANPSASCFACAFAILSGTRYKGPASPTEVA